MVRFLKEMLPSSHHEASPFVFVSYLECEFGLLVLGSLEVDLKSISLFGHLLLC